MSYEVKQSAPKLERYQTIRCFTCDKDLSGKGALKRHMGHELHYMRDGQVDD